MPRGGVLMRMEKKHVDEMHGQGWGALVGKRGNGQVKRRRQNCKCTVGGKLHEGE